jgi:hypothetical protein
LYTPGFADPAPAGAGFDFAVGTGFEATGGFGLPGAAGFGFAGPFPAGALLLFSAMFPDSLDFQVCVEIKLLQ